MTRIQQNPNSLGAVIVAMFFCIITTFITVWINATLIYNIFKTDEKRGVLAYELQKIELVQHSQIEDFQFNNIFYLNKNKLHCKVLKIENNYNLYNELVDNGWSFNGKYYIKDNLVAVVNEQGDNINLDLYYK